MSDNIRVAICDDHFFYRQGIRAWLEKKQDIDVIGESQNGSELLKQLKHIQPEVILLDINMPIMDGTMALPEIKKLYPNIKVVMLTMNDSKQMILEMLKLGADGYLTKNDDSEEIYNAIIACKNKGQYISQKNSDVLLQSLRNSPSIPSTNNDTITAPADKIKSQPKKFNIKKVLIYTTIMTIFTIFIIFVLVQLKVNLSPLENIEFKNN
jgi:DNA-binding NarL/FixJ family response regulator